MKQFILGFLAAIFIFKGSEIIYAHYWWEYNKICRSKNVSFDEEMKCVYSKMGIINYLGFLNINYKRVFDEYEWTY